MHTYRITAFMLVALMTLIAPSAHAAIKEGAASLFLPTTGQAMNGQLGDGKTKVMGTVEAASIITTAILGVSTGGATVLVGAVPMAINHIWSSMDAYKSARQREVENAMMGQAPSYGAQSHIQMAQSAYAPEAGRGYDVRERIRRAGETA